MLLAFAVLAVSAILPNGMGAYSLWTDASAAAVSGSVNTGQAQIISSAQPEYRLNDEPFDPAQDVLRPGETLSVSFDTTVLVTGSSMQPKLDLNGWTLPDSVRDSLEVSVTSSDLVVSPEEQIATVTLTLSSASDVVFNGELIDLSAAQLVLSTGTVWKDTLYPLDEPLQNVRLGMPVMQLVYDTTAPGAQSTFIVVPVRGLSLGSVTIDWGDGSPLELILSDNPAHTFAGGQYTVTINGAFTNYGYLTPAVQSANAALLSVPRWDANGVTNAAEAFAGAINLTEVATPPASITLMTEMFFGATSFNADISEWNVSNVTDMGGMFAGAAAFDQAIGTWDVSNVIEMTAMFSGATAFAQDLSAWHVEANIPTMPDFWNTNAPGLAPVFTYRWPLPWQPAIMKIAYDTTLPGASTNVVVPIDGLSLGTVTIDWGDGSPIETVSAPNPTHVYAGGQYTAIIMGKFTKYGSLSVAESGANASVAAVTEWSANGVTDLSYAFAVAGNLTSVVEPPRTVDNMAAMFSGASSFNSDLAAWNVSNVTNMSRMFFGAAVFNSDIGAWDVSHVTDMGSMFQGATVFNQDIGGWNVSAVSIMGSMFSQARAFNQNIGGWNVSNVTNMSGMFSFATVFNQDIGAWDVSHVTDMAVMFYGSAAFTQDLSGWNVATHIPAMPLSWNREAPGLSDIWFDRWPAAWQPFPLGINGPVMVMDYDTRLLGATNSVVLPVDGYQGSVWVNWGDGTPAQQYTSGMPSHNYATSKAYRVLIRGSFPRFGASGLDASNSGLVAVPRWEANGVTDLSYAFSGAQHLTSTVQPPLTAVNLAYMFDGAIKYNQDITAWNVSNVTNMSGMFNRTDTFNQAIGSWDVSNVTDMSWMFGSAKAFDQSLGDWNVSKVQNMSRMFYFTRDFNNGGSSSINDWTLSSLTTTSGMFRRAASFNQPINAWSMSQVTDISDMFSETGVFNQPLNTWDVSNVTDMNSTFATALAFDQDISAWNVSNVSDMTFMFFEAAAFSQNLSSWNVPLIPTMPLFWNQDAPGLASPTYRYRWPLAWQ